MPLTTHPPAARRLRRCRRAVAAGLSAGAVLVAAGCASLAPTDAASTTPGGGPGATASGGDCPVTTPIEVVVGENFWGSLATQLGGRYVHVTSLINNPSTDPHDYEPTPDDGRAVAGARYVIANGLGYDPWLTKLADANPVAGRVTLDVGAVLGRHDGDNPHRWYFPDDVRTVIDRITADYQRLVPDAAPCFARIETEYQDQGLARYHQLIDQLQATQAGAPIGGSESIVAGLADAGVLSLVTPTGYLDAISEGNDPAAQDKTTVDDQIDHHAIRVFVFNRQNATPDVQQVVDRATAAGIPVVSITETLAPADATFQDWQADQLQHLLDALATAPR